MQCRVLQMLSDSQLPLYANALKDNSELIESLCELLEDEQLNEVHFI